MCLDGGADRLADRAAATGFSTASSDDDMTTVLQRAATPAKFTTLRPVECTAI